MSDASAVQPDGTVVVEADTAAKALDEVTARLGSDATIVSAEKVLRGGVGGFFAREVVQLTARPADSPATPRSVRPDASVALREDNPAGPLRLHALLSELSDDAAREDRSFGEVLRSHLGEDAGAASPAAETPPPSGRVAAAPPRTPAPAPEAARPRMPADTTPAPTAATPTALSTAPATSAPAAPASERRPLSAGAALPADTGSQGLAALLASSATQTEAAPQTPAQVQAGTDAWALPRVEQARPALAAAPRSPEPAAGAPIWSVTNLVRLGLPQIVLDAVRGLDPRDDLAWVHAVGQAVGPLCRPLPAGTPLYAGPKAPRVASALGVPTAAVGAEPPAGAFATAVGSGRRGRTWLGWVRQERWLHLVAGGAGWRTLLFDEPLAVSWVDDEDLPQVLSVCADLGLVLGHGPASGRGAVPPRALPLDVALAVRALLPVR